MMTTDETDSKRALRRLMRSRKAACTAEELHAQSAGITARLLADSRMQAAQVVLAYYSLSDEVDTHELVDRLAEEGKTVLLPRVGEGRTMTLHRYMSAAGLQANRWHILEPTGEAYVDYEAIEVAVVPGMAFTTDGRRLGRGCGYYDRMLPLLRHAYKIGVGFDFQMVEELPTDGHDVLMDKVVAGKVSQNS